MDATTNRSKPTAPTERVITTLRLHAAPSAAWQCLMFYEDVPRKPWPLLRLLLPQPIKSEGDKLSLGADVRCTYERGYLLKRTTHVEPGRLLSFDVVEQQLGIERYARACHGSYELRAVGEATDMVLTTAYRAKLWPRFAWRPLERYLCHRLHLHILIGMRERLLSEGLAVSPNDLEGPGTARALSP